MDEHLDPETSTPVPVVRLAYAEVPEKHVPQLKKEGKHHQQPEYLRHSSEAASESPEAASLAFERTGI